jgi:hypothetical protein
MSYESMRAEVTECHRCGETRSCTVYVGRMEAETGYVDETPLCGLCDPESPNYEPPQSYAQRTLVISAEDPDFA